MRSEPTAIRQGEELPAAALKTYLREQFGGPGDDIAIEQFPSGHSNLTYLVAIGGREYVLRRAPLGPLPPKAHDMAREYRILEAVHPYFPEAPRVFHLCEDPSVIGAVFFLMERRRGIILRDQIPPEVKTVANDPRRISEAFTDCMVRLHSIDISSPAGYSSKALSRLGRPEGYLERQVLGWAERWRRAKTEESPEMDRVIEWLAGRLPRSPAPALLHNDYKLDNVVLSEPSLDRIEAVLDWEMAAVGDPLSDLGLTLGYWAWANAPEVRAASIPAFTLEPGWYTRDEFVERYARQSGRDVTGIGYYEVLGVFKIAVIVQQIYFRFHQGQTRDERFRNFGARVRGLVRLAASLTELYV
jgi:aminoglycoside phosphotransferase (APT) family kinase protein